MNMIEEKNKIPRIILVCGPTGVGKTSTAIHLAEMFNGEIINADSMQIHKLMDIGSAKPSALEQARVKHHLIDIIFPDEPFDANRFSREASDAAFFLHGKNILPFVVGGTGLYIKALLSGLFDSGASDSRMRESLKEEAREKGPSFLHEKLARHDPVAAKRIHVNDIFRTVRALEVFYTSGLSITERHKKHAFSENRFDALEIGLTIDRERLYKRIDRRVDEMMSNGFLEEVQMLMDMGYRKDLKSMGSIGYRHIASFITGDISREEAVRTMKRDTRRYAKRQMTWFAKRPGIIWAEPGNTACLEPLIKKHLNRR